MATADRLNITLGEAIFSLRAIRRLKPDPISNSDLKDILLATTQAPNGGNMQQWHFVVLQDPDIKRRFGEIYREAWWAKRNDSGYFTPEDIPANYSAAMRLADRIGEAPVIVLVCATTAGSRESVIPATQNLLLAARGLGIGGTITSLHPKVSDAISDLIDLPDGAQVVYCVPLGYPRGRFGPVTRKPTSEVVSLDSWGNTPSWA